MNMDSASNLLPFLLPLLTITSNSALLSWLHLSHLALLSLPFVGSVQYSNDPSSTNNNWTLSDYYYNDYNHTTDGRYYLPYVRYSNFTFCNNQSSNLRLLNDEKGIYGRGIDIYSAHALTLMPYTVYFQLYFAISVDRFCMKNNASTPAYYLSLVAANGLASGRKLDPNMGQIIWTANENKPVSRNACLQLGEDSNLKLVEYFDNIRAPEVVWQTHTTGQADDASLIITFEGNLILFSNTTNPPYRPYVPLWESFEHPTNALMVLQVLHRKNTLRNLVVRKNTDSASGNYTMVIENRSLVLYARIWEQDESEYGSPYWVWPNHPSLMITTHESTPEMTFVALCWDSLNQLRLYADSNRSGNSTLPENSTTLSPANCSSLATDAPSKHEQVMNIYQSSNVTYATFMSLDADGGLNAYTVNDTTYPNSTSFWSQLFGVFNDKPCSLPLYCGFYGICGLQSNNSSCTCDETNFKSADPSNNRSGCTLKNGRGELPINGSVCTTPSHRIVDFLQIQNFHYFSIDFTAPHASNDTADRNSCRNGCLRNCNCTAAFWNESTSSCFLIIGQLGTIQRAPHGNMTVFIKYVHDPHRRNWKLIWYFTAATALALVVACIFLLCIYKRRKAYRIRCAELENERLLLSVLESNNIERFKWKQMYEYTCGFSDLLGCGGFGRVFRGSLPDGTDVAVKQLEEDGSQGQGNKEFIAEVSILSRINHAHLVRLIGFCLEGMHKLLVYEYMENGSLDAWLFRNPVTVHNIGHKDHETHLDTEEKNKMKPVLPWNRRFQIALGTAKGLAYLHEECDDKVIHMDLKPQNILLGRNFLPKISDFGMSRRTGREQTSVMTVMRGTPGYLAPEWLLDFAITEKCDVYSFGIMLLEIVSGRKVKDLRALKQKLGMRPLRESVMMDLLDEDLRHYDSTTLMNEKEVVRTVEVALLCMRTEPAKRPTMSSVALMLEGKVEVLQEDAILDDGDGDDQHQLVMYPSTMNKIMRSMQRSSRSDSFTSFTEDDNSSTRNSFMKHFHIHDKKSISYMEIDTAIESDTLLDHY